MMIANRLVTKHVEHRKRRCDKVLKKSSLVVIFEPLKRSCIVYCLGVCVCNLCFINTSSLCYRNAEGYNFVLMKKK